MECIDFVVIVDEEGVVDIALKLKTDLPPGQHQARVLIERDQALGRMPVDKHRPIPVIHGGSWPEGFSTRREDLYGENGR